MALKKIGYAGRAAPPKRTSWLHDDTDWKELEKQLGLEPIVFFQDDMVADYGWDWLSEEQANSPIFDAVARADYNGKSRDGRRDPNGDIAALCDIIRDKGLETKWDRDLVADFIYRHLVRKRLPIYEMSRAELALRGAKKRVLEHIGLGLSRDAAIAKVASELDIPERILRHSVQGKRGSERRARKGFRGAVSQRPTKRPKQQRKAPPRTTG